LFDGLQRADIAGDQREYGNAYPPLDKHSHKGVLEEAWCDDFPGL